MNIHGKPYQTIWVKDESTVQVIDQRLLPFEFKVFDLQTVEDAYNAIYEMIIRGAPLIGVTASYGIYLALLHVKDKNNWKKELEGAGEYLKESRPTAVNLAYAVDQQVDKLKTIEEYEQALKTSLETADTLREKEIENCRLIGEYGFPLIEEIARKKQGEPVNILTHCNAGWLACIDYGTATAPIYTAHDKGINVHVWVDETRPRNQGARLTAFELEQHGVPHTVIADNTGGLLMQKGKVDLVIVGSDRTTAKGDVANKIGTYLKALAAKDNHIPFYVALPLSTIDRNLLDGMKDIPIEQRDGEEVKYVEGFHEGKIKKVQITPENSPAVNYGFDVTPAEYVTALITEKGICKPSEAEIKKLFTDA
ncbi:MAG: S-methyl-5-thioribose-1-phosphate isomerase [Bacteroidales bacterium]